MHFGCDRMDVEDEYNVATIYLTCVSAVLERMHLCLDPEKDDEKMTTFSMVQIISMLC